MIGGTGTAGGGGATTTTSSSTTGSGGGSTTTSSTTSTTTNPPPQCPIIPEEDLYTLEVGGDGALQVLAGGCYEALAYLALGGGGECSEGAMAMACGPGNEPEFSFNAAGLTAPGMVSGVAVYYRHGGQSYQSYDGTTTLVSLGAVGHAATGSYAATVVNTTDPTDVLTLAGDFVLCRAPDLPPCP